MLNQRKQDKEEQITKWNKQKTATNKHTNLKKNSVFRAKKKRHHMQRYTVYKKFTLNIKQDSLKEMEKRHIILILIKRMPE